MTWDRPRVREQVTTEEPAAPEETEPEGGTRGGGRKGPKERGAEEPEPAEPESRVIRVEDGVDPVTPLVPLSFQRPVTDLEVLGRDR